MERDAVPAPEDLRLATEESRAGRGVSSRRCALVCDARCLCAGRPQGACSSLPQAKASRGKEGWAGREEGGETEQGICVHLNLSSHLQAPTSRLCACPLIGNTTLKSPALTTSRDCC